MPFTRVTVVSIMSREMEEEEEAEFLRGEVSPPIGISWGGDKRWRDLAIH